MRMVKAPDKVEPWRVVCAAQSEPDYSEDRQILLYESDCDAYHNGGPFILLDGGHCSCYDWEEVEWDAIEYTRDELLMLTRSKLEGSGFYNKSEKYFWKMVELALFDDEAFGDEVDASTDNQN